MTTAPNQHDSKGMNWIFSDGTTHISLKRFEKNEVPKYESASAAL